MGTVEDFKNVLTDAQAFYSAREHDTELLQVIDQALNGSLFAARWPDHPFSDEQLPLEEMKSACLYLRAVSRHQGWEQFVTRVNELLPEDEQWKGQG